MKKVLISLLLTAIVSGFAANGQTKEGDRMRFDAIKIGCKFKLRLEPYDSLLYLYAIESLDTLAPGNDPRSLETDGLFPENVEHNTIEGYFYMDTSSQDPTNKSSRLILKSGMDSVLRYDAAILVPGKKKFEPTSVVQLYPQLPVHEIWPYPIEAIVLMWFRKAEKSEEPKAELENTTNQ